MDEAPLGYGQLEALCRPPRPPGRLPFGREVGFAQFVFLWNVIQRQRTPVLHRRIADWLEEAWREGHRRLLLMVFRNAGKSTLVGLFCAWLLQRDPNLRILVFSAEHGLATRMTRNVRRIVERHPLCAAIRPRGPGGWAQDQITVRRSRDLRDPSVLARGLFANVTGARADVIVCDDVEVPNTCDTPAKRAELRARLAELPFVLCPGGTILYVGTPHHYHSIYAAEPRPELGEERPFLDGYRRLVVPVRDAEGRSAWPERFSEEEIARIERESGPARFRSQMLLEPVPLEELRLDPGRLVVYEEEAEMYEANGELVLTIAGRRMVSATAFWDPAIGRPERGDASVVAVVFTDAEGHYFLHDLRYLDSTPSMPGEDEASVMCRQVAAFCATHAVPVIRVEVNGLGRFLPAGLRRELQRVGAPTVVREHHSHVPKDRRILEAFDPLLASRRLHVHRRVLATPFPMEMREWRPDTAGRDDGLDAVAGCLLAEPMRLRPFGPRPAARPDWRPATRSLRARRAPLSGSRR